jgi:ribosome modulation factor
MTTDDARMAGRWARDGGRGINECPLYGPTEADAEMRRAWMDGWREQDKLKAKQR